MRITKRTLEEAVLAVLYAKSLERPLWVNASEIYWSLPFADVSEGEVTAMLSELVEERRVKLYLGKYQLSKEEQIRIKEQEREVEEQKENMQEDVAECDEAQNPHQEKLDVKTSPKPRYTLQLLTVFLLGLVFGGLSWGICSSAFSSDTSFLPPDTSLEALQKRLSEVQTQQEQQGYLLMLTWLLLLAISGFLCYKSKRADSKKDKP